MEICASARTLKVGGTFTLAAQAVDIGLSYFYVMVRPAGAGDFQPLVTVTYNNEVKNQAGPGGPLEVVSTHADGNQLSVALRARAAGKIEVFINATGEVHYGYPGPARWAGGGSDPLSLSIEK